jgi:hypothetical protein
MFPASSSIGSTGECNAGVAPFAGRALIFRQLGSGLRLRDEGAVALSEHPVTAFA